MQPTTPLFLLGLVTGFILGIGSATLSPNTTKPYRILVWTYLILALAYLVGVGYSRLR